MGVKHVGCQTGEEYRIFYPISTVRDTLLKLNTTQHKAFLKFAQEQTYDSTRTHGDVYLSDGDDYAEVSDAQYASVRPMLQIIVGKMCPVFVKPFLQKSIFRIFVNKISNGTGLHFDGV